MKNSLLKSRLKVLGFFVLLITFTVLFQAEGAVGITLVAGPYVVVDVKKSLSGGAAQNKKPYAIFYRVDDTVISSFKRDQKGVLIAQDIQCLPGKYGFKVYGTIDKTAPKHMTDGETDAKSFQHQLGFEIPGDDLEVDEFLFNNLNKDFIVAVGECEGEYEKVIGTPCHPLQINPESLDDSTGKKTMLKMEGVGRTKYPIGRYAGNHTLATPLAVIAQDDLTPSVDDGPGQYQLQDNTQATAITTLDDAQDGFIYTLLGSGGLFPSSIASGNDFILQGGVTWNAAAGTQISFRAIDIGGGSFNFIETSRTV